MHYKKIFIALILAFTFLAGCASSGIPGGASDKSPANGAENASSVPGEISAVPGEITVSSAEELLEAIQPGAALCIAPGTYNLSDYLAGVSTTRGEEWNNAHEYVQIRDCYDGFEVFIQNTDGLSIRGGGETMADTEIVVDPRYATVFNFDNCANLKLSNLTLGHTDLGMCVGNVLNFRACKTMELRNMDLYGCGALGIECSDAADGLSVYDSTIRDCSYGPLTIYGCTGKFAFYDCTMTGSDSGGYYEKVGNSELSFYRCTFGEAETRVWYRDPDIYAEDCDWSEITSYSDYGEEEGSWESEPDITFQPETMAEADLESAAIEGTFWIAYTGYTKTDGQAEEVLSLFETADGLAAVSMSLDGNGTGTLNGYFPEKTPVPFLWEQDSENPAHVTFFTLHHGSFSGTFYQPAEEDVYPSVWLSLQMENARLWLY